MTAMLSVRFRRTVVVTRHARMRMAERQIQVVLEQTLVVKTVMHHFSIL